MDSGDTSRDVLVEIALVGMRRGMRGRRVDGALMPTPENRSGLRSRFPGAHYIFLDAFFHSSCLSCDAKLWLLSFLASWFCVFLGSLLSLRVQALMTQLYWSLHLLFLCMKSLRQHDLHSLVLTKCTHRT